ncbi:1-acyl-sn-glycerol-3-phosphate acyltransferase [Runella aurantiaca]|uniref:Glycerol acyltransferase n=1 Tax=Runella aurantiaca TaxID=2282308 RepID=A0A369I874_9BACT|nr:1-acyl-sn-glycerol-3-phosphate acyltransferase [Runella aurantiaca]RDB02876.1 glycerol acyltransferase [Runella aurantiaca]
MNWLFAFLYRIFGWGILGRVPKDLKKAIWVVCPHWNSSDFFIGVGVRAFIGVKMGFLGKSSLFKWYSAWFFRALGGYPVYREKSNNLVDAVAETFKQNEFIHIAIAPEGTRSNTSKLKTGFYFMALKAQVPLVLVGFDYTRKLVVFGEPIYLTGDYVKDMKPFYDFYLTIQSPKKEWLQLYEQTGVIPFPKEQKTER